ncbi:suppressor of glycerol defect [Entomophthora muscae]|uniref:Suppressor of glycerol defect n=1 Tax=Entomophthora muscae TaxID=34485 RepID=A0ACC2TJM1_9FUNG|nr:suppressor of glycerol defect [Entomophthora muscae]
MNRKLDELSEKAKPTPVEVTQPRGNSKKRKLPVEEAEPVIPDNRKFSKRFVNKIASRKEQRKAERKNKKQKKQTPAQKITLKANPSTEDKPQKHVSKDITKIQPKAIPAAKEVPKISKADVEEEEEDRYLRQLEKKLKIKDASKVLNSSLFKDDGLDELLSGITVGSNKLLGKKDPKAESSELDESESDSEEELLEGAHYYSTRNQHEKLSEEDSGSSEASSGSKNEVEKEKDDENAVVSKYVPPHLRKDDDKLVKLRRLLQGLINKLNETNIESILADIDQMYLDYSRNNVTTTITDLILLSVSERSNLSDSFVIINATIIAGVYRLVGTEAAAHFTQTLVEKLMKHHSKAGEGEDEIKMCLNLITLVAELYNLGVVSCVLIYSIIRFFLQDMVPHNVELLLKMIRAIGPALRQDDPSAMKDIILLAQKNAPTGAKLGVRFKFMMEVLNDLKNNKVKKSSHLATQNALAEDTVRRMKTLLKNIEKRRQTINSEPLQVSLDDIMSASTKGKWWLVGAAWKGEEVPVQKVDSVESNDPNTLLTLARQQRMSTDLRKRIFTVLMSSEDFTDAYERLMKLGLTEKQQRDIPRVLLHCCGNEKTYNPFYSLVAARLNAYRASFKITFQYALWDFLRELGESGVGGLGGTHSSTTSIAQVPVRRLINLAKFFGYLLGKLSLPLTILKSLTFTSLKPRSRLFLQLAIIHQFINTDDESIASQVAKLADLKDLRQGLAFFIHHFVATPTDLASSSLSVQEKETVASRAKFAEDLLKL